MALFINDDQLIKN